MKEEIRLLLEGVREGSVSVEEALERLKAQPFADLGYAKVDHHRALRQGAPEVIYGAGKTPEQIIGIAKALLEAGQGPVLITRMGQTAAEIVGAALLLRHTSTLGVREQAMGRYTLERSTETVDTPWGPVRRKTASGFGLQRQKYEYEDLARIAREQGLSLEEVRGKLRVDPGSQARQLPRRPDGTPLSVFCERRRSVFSVVISKKPKKL